MPVSVSLALTSASAAIVPTVMWPIATVFLVHGLILGSWISRIPAIESGLQLGHSKLGFVLLAMGIGSIAAMPLAARAVDRFGSRAATSVSTVGFALTLTLPSFAANWWSLAATLVLLGAFAGSMDVAMNAQGVLSEIQSGRAIMSRLHAMFSVGAMSGAAIGALVSESGIGIGQHLVVAGVILAAGSLPLLVRLTGGVAQYDSKTPRGRTNSRAGLAGLAFCFFLGEGAIGDWSGLLLRDEHAADAASAGLGYAMFAGAMAAGRFVGDALVNRMGRRFVAVSAALCAACGLILLLMAGTFTGTYVGFAIAGLGFSVVVPLALAGAGRISSHTLAVVTAAGYAGFLIGPPVIGFMAEAAGLRNAFWLVAMLSAIGVPIAARSLRFQA